MAGGEEGFVALGLGRRGEKEQELFDLFDRARGGAEGAGGAGPVPRGRHGGDD